MKLQRTRVDAFVIPTSGPEADGTLAWNKTTLVVVRVAAGKAHGLGATYANLATAHFIQEVLFPVVDDCDVFATSACWWAMQHAVRNMGHQGVAAMAISAVDAALWDLKAQILGLPLVTLLGQVRSGTPCYGSGGFTSYSQEELEEQLETWAHEGFHAVKMKVGRRARDDASRVAAVRRRLGDRVRLFVDANGAYSRRHALQLSEAFALSGVTWFEEPVSSDDLEGLAWLREHVPTAMDVAAGEYIYDSATALRMLQSGAVDVLQADVTRCGGITGFLAIDALCTAHNTPLSAHCAPSLHAHVACAAASLRHLEYFHDHARIEHMLFEGALMPHHGNLCPDLTAPGNGLVLRDADAQRFAA